MNLMSMGGIVFYIVGGLVSGIGILGVDSRALPSLMDCVHGECCWILWSKQVQD